MRKTRTNTLAIAASSVLTLVLLFVFLTLGYQYYRADTVFVSATQPRLHIGPQPGSQFPGLQAQGVHGNVTLLPIEPDAQGAVLVVLQSVVRNEHCAAQLRQLQRHQHHFTASGLSLLVLVQDNADALEKFMRENAIKLPVLRDDHALSAKTLGLLGNGGVHPGALIIAANNTISDTLFLANPDHRIDAAALLKFAANALD